MIIWLIIFSCFLFICFCSSFSVSYNKQKSLNISNYLKLIKVAKHLLNCCHQVSLDMVYIEENVGLLSASLIDKALKGELDEEDEKILDIFKNKNLEDLNKSLNKIASKMQELKDFNPYKKMTNEFYEIVNYEKSEDIINYFLSERDLENCRSVYFLKNKIKELID